MKYEQKVGVEGEFQVRVIGKDGKVRIDTGPQRNMILDNGLKLLLGLPLTTNTGVEWEHRNIMMQHCVVGTDSTPPNDSDIALGSFLSTNTDTRDNDSGKELPTDTLHPNYVKLWKRKKYIFDDINNQNITEVGLAPFKGDFSFDSGDGNGSVRYEDQYVLATKALIKGPDGQPMAITVLEGEILEVIYQINLYIDIRRVTGEFTLTTNANGVDTTDTFEYFIQPYVPSSGGYIDYAMRFSEYYASTDSWGVKESPDTLDSSYDLATWDSLTYDDTAIINTNATARKSSGYNTTSPYNDNYRIRKDVNRDFTTLTNTTTFSHGIYTHIHTNGIRVYDTTVTQSVNQPLVAGLVVVKNKATGGGIIKTDRQKWDNVVKFTIARYQG